MVTPTPTTVQVKIQLRSDTSANWASVNPVLLSGEMGLETDTNKFKIGNGSTAWNSLGYFPFVVSGGTVTGNLEIGSTGTLTFEGSTADGFETMLAVTDPTADRTITLPDQSGTVIVSGNASIVNADIAAGAEIAVSKLANGTANQVLVTDGTDVSWSDDLTLAGNLTVNGTTTTVNSQTLVVEDKNIELGVVDTPTDLTADGGGITLKGTTDKTINWVDATDSWTSSENIDLANGKSYRINGTEVLSATTLGSGVTSSSLTSVGTLGSVTVTGDATAGTFIPTSGTAPTNGLYLPATNSVALSTNGTGRLFVDASGNVGVAQPTPAAALHVYGTSNTTVRVEDQGEYLDLVYNDNGSTVSVGTINADNGDSSVASTELRIGVDSEPRYVIYADGTHQFLKSGGTNDAMRITSAGLVGIGTSSPEAPLTINPGNTGTTSLGGRSINYGSNLIAASGRTGHLVRVGNNFTTNNDNSGFMWVYPFDTGGDSAYKVFRSATGSTLVDKFWVSQAGGAYFASSVGIGTTSPAQALHLNEDDNECGIVITSSNTGASVIQLGDQADTNAGQITYLNSEDALLFRTAGSGEDCRIDSSGRLLVGTSNARTTWFTNTVTPQVQLEGASANASALSILRTDATSAGARLALGQLNGGSLSLENYTAGEITFQANDGTNLIRTASIAALVDGTPAYAATNLVNGQTYRIVTVGTTDFTLIGASANVVGTVFTATGPGTGTGTAILNAGNMPGRLVFSTTASGASSPTERMRIDSAGFISLGGDTNTGFSNPSADNLAITTGGSERARIDSSGRLLVGTSTSYDSTSALQLRGASGSYVSQTYVVNNSSNLVAGNGLAYLIFRDALNSGQGAWIGAIADGTWATSPASYPTRLVFSTTADGASSPTERMRISSDGRICTDGSTNAAQKLRVAGVLPSSANASVGLNISSQVPSATTDAAYIMWAQPTTEAASFTLSTLAYYLAAPGSFGTGSSVTNQYGFYAFSNLTGAANNYGFYSNISNSSGRWNFYANGAAPNYFAGTIASLGSYNNTTASAANVFIASNGDIQRSTSSIRYKTDVEDLETSYADNVIFNARPVWYRSLCEADNAGWSYYGLIAEEIAELDPRLVFWGHPTKEIISEEAKPAVLDDDGNEIEPAQEAVYTNVEDTDAVLRPEGVQYDRLTVMLIDVVQRQQKTIESLEARVAALETS